MMMPGLCRLHRIAGTNEIANRHSEILCWREILRTKKSGLKVVTLIATPNPVSQVLW